MTKTRILASTAIALGWALPLAAADLLVFDWSGYEDPGFFPAYIEAHGDGPDFAFFGDDDDAFQKLVSGFRADVSHPCSQMVGRFRDADLIEPWDVTKMPLADRINPALLASDIYKDAAGLWYVPIDWGSTAIAYMTESVPAEDVASLNVFLDPKYAGRISLPDNNDDVWALAFLATGVTDWTSITEDQYQAAAAWLRQAHPNVRAYWADGAELSQLMATGEVLISWAWNEILPRMQGEGHQIAYQRAAAEGSTTWFCGYVNLKDGPGEEDLAYDFINAWLEARSADYIVANWGYGHSNAEAMANQPADLMVSMGLNTVDAPVLAQVPMDNAMRDRTLAEFEKIKAGF